MSALNDLFAGIGDAAVTKGIAIGVGLADTGVAFAIALFGFFLAWRSVQLQFGANDSVAEWFADVVEKLIMFAMVMFLLKGTGIYQEMMKTWIWGAVMSLVERVGNEGWSGGGGAKAAITALAASIDQYTDAMFEAYNKTMVQPSIWKPETWLTFLVVGAAVTIANVILFVAKAIVLVSFASGAVMYAIGAALGPMFIPLLLNDRFENFFWSWLRYLITSAMVLLVATVMVVIMVGVLKPVIQPGGIAYSSIAVSSLTGLAVDAFKIAFFGIVVAIFMAYLLSQVTEIANALFSGNISGIKSGVGAVGRGLRNTSSAAKSAAGSTVGRAILPSLSGGGKKSPSGGVAGGSATGTPTATSAAAGGVGAAAAATAVAAAAAATGATAARTMSGSSSSVPNNTLPAMIAAGLDKAAASPDAGPFTKALANTLVPGAGNPLPPSAPSPADASAGQSPKPPSDVVPTVGQRLVDDPRAGQPSAEAEQQRFDPKTAPAKVQDRDTPYKAEVAETYRAPVMPTARTPRRNRGADSSGTSQGTGAGGASKTETGSSTSPTPPVMPDRTPPRGDADQ